MLPQAKKNTKRQKVKEHGNLWWGGKKGWAALISNKNQTRGGAIDTEKGIGSRGVPIRGTG